MVYTIVINKQRFIFAAIFTHKKKVKARKDTMFLAVESDIAKHISISPYLRYYDVIICYKSWIACFALSSDLKQTYSLLTIQPPEV